MVKLLIPATVECLVAKQVNLDGRMPSITPDTMGFLVSTGVPSTAHKECFLTCQLLNSEKYQLPDIPGIWKTSLNSAGYDITLLLKKRYGGPLPEHLSQKVRSVYKRASQEAKKMVSDGHPYWTSK